MCKWGHTQQHQEEARSYRTSWERVRQTDTGKQYHVSYISTSWGKQATPTPHTEARYGTYIRTTSSTPMSITKLLPQKFFWKPDPSFALIFQTDIDFYLNPSRCGSAGREWGWTRQSGRLKGTGLCIDLRQVKVEPYLNTGIQTLSTSMPRSSQSTVQFKLPRQKTLDISYDPTISMQQEDKGGGGWEIFYIDIKEELRRLEIYS